MSVQNIGTEQTAALPGGLRNGTGQLPQATISHVRARADVVRLPGESVDFVQLQARKTEMSKAAERIRAESESLVKLDDYISLMQASLERITKQFPPYPPGSEERSQLLMNYGAFRRLVEQLTLPPPEREAAAPAA